MTLTPGYLVVPGGELVSHSGTVEQPDVRVPSLTVLVLDEGFCAEYNRAQRMERGQAQ